jgi:hypothetical protein
MRSSTFADALCSALATALLTTFRKIQAAFFGIISNVTKASEAFIHLTILAIRFIF